jgi:ABC-type branched-subunit amino acid transport system substrate-binding protein
MRARGGSVAAARNAAARCKRAGALLLLLFLLAACSPPGSAAPVVKLGVIAPFEGEGRALGYAILPSIKEAVAEANASGSLGPYRVVVVAFDDSLDPSTARRQATALGLDSDVIGVVGPFSQGTIAAAAPVLAAASVREVPVATTRHTGEDFSQEKAQARAAARRLLEALAADIEANGRPTRPATVAR